MILVCVDIKNPLQYKLTLYKTYTVDFDDDQYSVDILNDSNQIVNYRRCRFMRLEDFRNKQIDSLL